MKLGHSRVAASVRARLLNVARAQGADFNQVLVRFALERILYRLTQSRHADRFLLKGALLFTLWYEMPHRSTRDADLLGYGANDLDDVAATFREIAAITVDDGILFHPVSVNVEAIRKDAGYGGVRVVIAGELANARVKTQVDVGFGDVVTPAPVDALYPVLLDDLPAPRLRTYPIYTVVAEKLHAIVLLGMTNSRMKDYFDLSVLVQREAMDPVVLSQAIAATFERRRTRIPESLPLGLSDEFAHDPSRQALWQAFQKKNELTPEPFLALINRIRGGLWSAMRPTVRSST